MPSPAPSQHGSLHLILPFLTPYPPLPLLPCLPLKLCPGKHGSFLTLSVPRTHTVFLSSGSSASCPLTFKTRTGPSWRSSGTCQTGKLATQARTTRAAGWNPGAAAQAECSGCHLGYRERVTDSPKVKLLIFEDTGVCSLPRTPGTTGNRAQKK